MRRDNPMRCFRSDRATQPAHAVDAAARPQDRCFFETYNQTQRVPDLLVAARLMGNRWAALCSPSSTTLHAL